MNPETMPAWLQAKQGRHRLTIPNHIKKALDRLLSKDAETHRKAKKKANRKKPVKPKNPRKYRCVGEEDRPQIEALARVGLSPRKIGNRIRQR